MPRKKKDDNIPELTPEMIGVEVIDTPTPRTRVRSEFQRYVDGIVQDSYDAWVKAGSPTARREMPGYGLNVPTLSVSKMESALRSAVEYLGYGLAFHETLSGNTPDSVRIVFTAKDRIHRKRKPKK